MKFGVNCKFDSLPGSRAQILSGPVTDRFIATELYVDPNDSVKHSPDDFSVVLVDIPKLQPRWKSIYLGGEDKPFGGVPSADVATSAGDPKQDANYIQNVTKSVGIPIWGGNFQLYHQRIPINGMDKDSVVLARTEPHLYRDTLKGFTPIDAVYKTRAAADAALKAFSIKDAYTYYLGAGNHIWPTTISDTSAPKLCEVLRQMIDLERSDAKAASHLTLELGLWALGARTPVNTAKPGTLAEASAGARGGRAGALAAELKAAGKPVRVNLGGTGEVADAINVNPVLDQQVKDIPRLIKGRAEDVAQMFESGVGR